MVNTKRLLSSYRHVCIGLVCTASVIVAVLALVLTLRSESTSPLQREPTRTESDVTHPGTAQQGDAASNGPTRYESEVLDEIAAIDAVRRGSEPDADDAFYVLHAPYYVARSKGFSDTLSAESVADSMTNLSEVEWYYEWHLNSGAMRLSVPLQPGHGALDLERVLQNRRFRKLLVELRGKPSEQSEALLAAEIDATLSQYSELFWSEWERIQGIYSKKKPDERIKIGPTVQTSSKRDGTPTIEGLRLKILALSLLATNLQMDGVTPELKAVTREALHQRSYFYEVPGESQRDGLAMLAMLGIYNRSILAGAVVGLGHGIDSLPDFAKRRGNFEDPNEAARWKAWKPTRGVAREACWFRDETGSFEACMFRNNVEKLKEDLSHGTVTIRYMNPNLGEDEFNAILEQAGWGETQNTTSAP